MITEPIQGFFACVRFPSHWVFMNSSMYSTSILVMYACYWKMAVYLKVLLEVKFFLSSKSKDMAGVSFCPEIVL